MKRFSARILSRTTLRSTSYFFYHFKVELRFVNKFANASNGLLQIGFASSVSLQLRREIVLMNKIEG